MTQPKTLAYSFSQKKAIYFRVPKVASSSLLIAFRKVDTVELTEEHDSWFTFGFVRDPFDRLASCYRHVIRNGTPEVLDSCPGMSRTMSFPKFVEAVCAIKDVQKMDMHFRPQHTFFPKKPDLIVKFERLKEDYLSVCKIIAIKGPELTRTNSTDKTVFKDYYSDKKILKMVVDLYKKDFSLFGYSESIPNNI